MPTEVYARHELVLRIVTLVYITRILVALDTLGRVIMKSQTHITVVGTPTTPLNFTMINNQLNTTCDHVPDIPSLLNNINNVNTCSDLILFDLPVICDIPDVGAYEIGSLIDVLARMNHHVSLPTMAVLVDKHSNNTWVRQILDTNIKGVVPHDSWFGMDATVDAITTLLQGQIHMPKKIMDHFLSRTRHVNKHKLPELTPRQTQVLNLITSRGASNKVIARSLKISESTVKVHVGAIFKKYGVRNRTQLALCGVNGRL
jgi:DNA-binding NarL/FixJ family response regulator